MNNEINVQINGTTFKMSFSLKVFRTLGRVWGLDTIPEVMGKVALIEQADSGRLDVYDVLFDVLFQCIDSHSGNVNKISKEEIEDLPLEVLIELAGSMTVGITEAFEQASEPEKKNPAPKK